MSQLPVQVLKNPPKDADTVNHKLLVQAGFVRQLMAGVYTYLPLGLRVLNKVRNVIREEMNELGANEILMPNLHPAANWKATGGWENVDVLFKLKSQTGKDYALGQSHEEVVTPLAKEFIHSYKDLPIALYQINWKFRDELRAKSGIMRGREFEMKDMYSFHETQEDFERFYALVKQAYQKAYKRVGLDVKVTEASGGNFTDKISYEFMAITDAGEDDILYCKECDYCINTEIAKTKEGDACPKCTKGKLFLARASEVGNVFDLGQKFVNAFDVSFTNREGKSVKPIMGCYGWGTTRTIGVLAETFNDQRGLIWPLEVAPFTVQLISLDDQSEKAAITYESLKKAGVDVLWDDREISAGIKFADADLIGNPYRVVISKKSLEAGGAEVKRRCEPQMEIVALDKLVAFLNG
jgi:prolyl-tRNA synthetase